MQHLLSKILRHHDDQEEYGNLILEESPQGGAPVGIAGVAASFRLFGVEVREGEQLLVGHGFGIQFRAKLLGELIAQGVGGLAAQSMESKTFHQREPSFLAKLMRGSTMPMRISPNRRPKMEITA